jgi:hypothetical protein
MSSVAMATIRFRSSPTRRRNALFDLTAEEIRVIEESTK